MLGRGRYKFKGLRASATYSGTPQDAVSDGNFTSQDITVSGASLGDWARASFSTDITDLQLDAQVTVAGTVTVTFYNNTGGSVTPSGTIYVSVDKR